MFIVFFYLVLSRMIMISEQFVDEFQMLMMVLWIVKKLSLKLFEVLSRMAMASKQSIIEFKMICFIIART